MRSAPSDAKVRKKEIQKKHGQPESSRIFEHVASAWLNRRRALELSALTVSAMMPDTHARRVGFLFAQRLFRRHLSTCIHTHVAHTQFVRFFVFSIFLQKIHWMQSIQFESECDAELKKFARKRKNRKENRKWFLYVSYSHTFKVKLVLLQLHRPAPSTQWLTFCVFVFIVSIVFPLLIVPMRTDNEINKEKKKVYNNNNSCRLQAGKVKKNTFKSKMSRETKKKQCKQCRHRRDMCSNACSRISRSYRCQVIYTLNVCWR